MVVLTYSWFIPQLRMKQKCSRQLDGPVFNHGPLAPPSSPSVCVRRLAPRAQLQ